MRSAIFLLGLILGLTLCSTRIMAQDHLVPEPSILADTDDYHQLVRTVFVKIDEPIPVLKVNVLPPFENELVIGLLKQKQGYQVFSQKSSQSLMLTLKIQHEAQIPGTTAEALAMLRKRAPKEPQEITVETQRVELPTALAERIQAVWEKALLEVRHPPQPRFCVDGDTAYHFSMPVSGRGTISGGIWSPVGDSKMKKLVNLVHAMGQYSLQKVKADAIEAALKPLE